MEKLQNEERTFLFVCLFVCLFVFCFSLLKTTKISFGSPKWELSTGKKNFMSGKKSGKMILPPQKNMPVTPLKMAAAKKQSFFRFLY